MFIEVSDVQKLVTDITACLFLKIKFVFKENCLNILQKLVKIWLDVLKSEEPSVDSISENVSKMLELVSGHHLRIIFLKLLVKKVRYSFAADAAVTVFS